MPLENSAAHSMGFKDPQLLQLPLSSTKGYDLQVVPKLFSSKHKMTQADHTTQHRQTIATCEAVGHDGHTNEDVHRVARFCDPPSIPNLPMVSEAQAISPTKSD